MERRPLGLRLAAPFRSASYVVVVVLCAAVLTFGAMFYLWQRYQYVRLGFQVDRLRARKARLVERIEPLQVEAAYLARPERIDALARDQLGMRMPRPSQVIVEEPGAAPAKTQDSGMIRDGKASTPAQ